MFNILIDTCVWLDLAKDPRQHPVLGVIEQMVHERLIALIVPQIVVEEFRRNRARIEKDRRPPASCAGDGELGFRKTRATGRWNRSDAF